LGINTVIDFLSLTPTELMKFDGYKQTKSKRIVDGIQENRTMILSLLPSFNILSEPEPKKVSNSMGKLAGKSFVICLTGTMSRPRKELAALIESHGHRVSDSVGQGVTHLCQADPASQSSKTKKAQKMSIPIINEQQLLDMLA
jgi:DNA ligase (NAD+)